MAKKKQGKRSVGRPAKFEGEVVILTCRVAAEMADRIDREAKRRGLVEPSGRPGRSECIRQLLDEGLR